VNQTFAEDCEALEKSIKKLKSRASAAGQSDSGPSSSQCCNRRPSLPSAITTDESRLASRAKDLRTMTEKRFSEVIQGWKRQNEQLEQELEMYKSQQRVATDRVNKRNAEIKTLREENEKLVTLVRQCEERINKLHDVKQREIKERQRADRLADQLFEHKAMLNDLQVQLKEAETLLVATKEERDHLSIDNCELRKTNTVLRQRLETAERDTKETKLELEMIEDMVQSINERSYMNQQSHAIREPVRVAPKKSLSALTALRQLQGHHHSGMETLDGAVRKLKQSETEKTLELDRLRGSFN